MKLYCVFLLAERSQCPIQLAREMWSLGLAVPDAWCSHLSVETGIGIWDCMTEARQCSVFRCEPCHLALLHGFEAVSFEEKWPLVCWSAYCFSLSLASVNKGTDASKLPAEQI